MISRCRAGRVQRFLAWSCGIGIVIVAIGAEMDSLGSDDDRGINRSAPASGAWTWGLIVTVAFGIAAVSFATRPNPAKLLAEARVAFREKRYPAVLTLIDRYLQHIPTSADALILAGGAAAADGNAPLALQYYDQLTSIDHPRVADAECVAAHLLFFEMHRPTAAEAKYRRVLERFPHHGDANVGLANLLGLTAQRWEAIPPTLELIRQGKCNTNQLILIGSERGGLEEPQLLQQCGDDPLALIGLSWYAAREGEVEKARALAQQALIAAPNLVSAQVQLGTLLLETAGREEFIAWHSGLPPATDAHPEIWLVRGEWARRHDTPEVAMRCYWECLRRNPNYRTALYQLTQLLVASGQSSLAEPFLKRMENLQRLKEAEAVLFEGIQTTLEPIRRVALHLEGLGRFWEVRGWCQLAMELDPQARWPLQLERRIAPALLTCTTLTAASLNPVFAIDLSHYPLPQWNSSTDAVPARLPGVQNTPAATSFDEATIAAGIDFTYYNSADAATPGQQMYEFSGGGVAALDFDVDGWCDLYFTQGCAWPVNEQDHPHVDQLFRNRGDGQFENVTIRTGIVEPRFGQGLSAGDYDHDGFPDLYIGNIGGNRLFHNNGDGTFTDATAALPLDPGRWTTSCVLADLNGDGLADIYAANYLEGPDIFSRMCQHKDGVARMCAPFDFDASQDQFLLNSGDGRFVDATTIAGFQLPHGKGLGVVAADFDGSGKLSLMVANDLVPNFHFVNQTPSRGASPNFVEQGFVSGLALNVNGQAQGSMGLAVDDWNQDGRLDLFVTNFLKEGSTLYRQSDHGSFQDDTVAAGLLQPSLVTLGFGTQSLDGDLDGFPDLIVTNGHVDDHRAYGQPYRMPMQYYHNLGAGQFFEATPDELGPFFGSQHLGRGLARLDWNRDGREEVAVSHLGEPAALLMNTSNGGHFIAVHVRGVQSDRDAIGTTVVVTSKIGTRVRQLTAGDGYQASNQRLLVFGLGEHAEIDGLEIRWPSGLRQSFDEVPADCEMILVEGRSEPVVLSANGGIR